MQSAFKAAMKKLSLVGQNELSLVDCSEVILPAARVNDSPHFPHGTSEKDVDQSVRAPLCACLLWYLTERLAKQCNMPFPDLPTTA